MRRVVISFLLSLPLSLGVGVYSSIISSNVIWLILAVVSWGYYFTIMGTLGSFLIDVAGPALGSLTLAAILVFINVYERFLFLTPFSLSYAAMMYLVTKSLASQVHLVGTNTP